MKRTNPVILAASIVSLLASFALISQVNAADADEAAIEKVMKTYHKAPKGEDPVCKKAVDGKATPEEIKKLVAAYKTLAAAKPPRGEAASWKEKTSKLLTAAEGLEKGGAEATAKYKAALNCKACHDVHKPE